MTTAFVATIGGHISELVELSERLPKTPQIWVSNDSPQTRDLLADRTSIMVPFIGERDRLGVLKAVPQARQIFKFYGVERVISTGSAIALGYLPVAAAMGIEAHYIESSTRVESCSVTGKLLAKTPGVNCWWQFDTAPEGFAPISGVYDRFTANFRTENPRIAKVVVTVGTTDRDFRRLIARLVDIMPAGVEVLWQTGASRVDDLGIDAHPLVPESELAAAIADADVVVTHAGAGSLATVLAAGKVPVFVPRRAEFDEQIDDHQVELARWADENSLAITAEADQVDMSHLEAAASFEIVAKPVGELVLT
jgi:UDP-N-acetylglucosamine transferase subunit ALG13